MSKQKTIVDVDDYMNLKMENSIFEHQRTYQQKEEDNKEIKRIKLKRYIDFIISYHILLVVYVCNFIFGIISMIISVRFLSSISVMLGILLTMMFNIIIISFLIYETYAKYENENYKSLL